MSTLIYDLRYRLRMLLKNPGFTFAALITLALSIASSTAIFRIRRFTFSSIQSLRCVKAEHFF
jgi:hypothetical protein